MLLVLAVVAGCAPVGAVEDRRAGEEPSRAAPLAPTAAALPSVRPSPWTSFLPSPSPTSTVQQALPSPSAVAEPAPAAPESPSSGLFAVNVASRADFVPQYTFEWCVGASLQMARSIITGGRNETRRSQRRLWELARDLSDGKYGGANPIGWTAALNKLGLGRYRLVSRPTFEDAVNTAARALAETERPVGLVMWAGRHAWMMTGFEATGDPRDDDGAEVTKVRVMDPLYPHGSRWGKSPAPNRLVNLRTLARQFVFRNRPDYDLGVAPGWLLVLPVE